MGYHWEYNINRKNEDKIVSKDKIKKVKAYAEEL